MAVSSSRPDAEGAGPVCPECGSSRTEAKSARGATVRSFLGGGVLDAAGLVNHDMRLRFACQDCHLSFFAEDVEWDGDQLTEPCTIVLHRERWLVGALMPLTVHLNGSEVGSVANGGSIEFATLARMNTIAVTDHNGAIRPSMSQTFEADAGGSATFRLKKTRLSRL